MGPDILDYTLHILNSGGIPDQINNTFISLIPKLCNPSTSTDFRLISLYNVIMKIISKTVANRIKVILPSIMNETHSAFLTGRLITKNSLIAFEIFYYLKQSKSKHKGYVGIKLDIAKAYDSLEWDFIEKSLTAMSFPTKTIALIMKCIQSVSFDILLNGNPTGVFYPQTGIRQGDPLSSYLFIICVELLSGLITNSRKTRPDSWNIHS